MPHNADLENFGKRTTLPSGWMKNFTRSPGFKPRCLRCRVEGFPPSSWHADKWNWSLGGKLNRRQCGKNEGHSDEIDHDIVHQALAVLTLCSTSFARSVSWSADNRRIDDDRLVRPRPGAWPDSLDHAQRQEESYASCSHRACHGSRRIGGRCASG
jgi:hypothetical protein